MVAETTEEMSKGCRAAWEQWRMEQIKKVPSNVAAHFWNTNPYSENAFVAGFEAALASLARYGVHLDERAYELELQARHLSASHFRRLGAETVNAELWIREGITCGVGSHSRCQEAQKR